MNITHSPAITHTLSHSLSRSRSADTLSLSLTHTFKMLNRFDCYCLLCENKQMARNFWFYSKHKNVNKDRCLAMLNDGLIIVLL